MKKIIFAVSLLLSLCSFSQLWAYNTQYQVKKADIYEGYIAEKVWLDNYAIPSIALSEITFEKGIELPKDAKTSDPSKFLVKLGMERKRPFAMVYIPAYVAGGNSGSVNQVSGFTMSVTETAPQQKRVAARTTDVTTSALATGTWYKIAVTKTGFYKIDNSFLTTMGVKPADVNPANIRIFGNGGHMLSENNAVPRPADLIENALWVSTDGASTFSSNDFVVFYGVGPTAWTEDSVNLIFNHVKNLYSDTAYYFVTFDQGPGLRISQQPAISGATETVTNFNYYDVHDTDEVNPAALGQIWYGEQFYPQIPNLTQTFTFNAGTSLSQVFCNINFGSTCDVAGSTVTAQLNGGATGSTAFAATGGNTDVVMSIGNFSVSGVSGNPQSVNVTLTFNPADGSGIGYLDYIEFNALANLSMTGNQMNFRTLSSVGAGNVANYQLQGANGNTQVWDVTDPQVPVLMSGTLSGSTYSFVQRADVLHEFAAMNNTSLYTPSYVGTVANQNLHGSGQVDLIVVAYPGFESQAQTLANYHMQHDNLKPIVVTTTQVYNEFSSGAQDISAIRDFARMFYKRAADSTQMPRYLLLFGGASYDYKNRVPDNSDFVPVYESAESSNDLNTFCTDDFYGFLDDSEYIENDALVNTLDIAVGRLPARSTADANVLINKAMNYNAASTLGPWRISSLHMADKGCLGNGQIDGAGDHMQDAESVAATTASAGKNLYNETKVYVDALPITSTPAGSRCPAANAAIDEQIYEGTFLVNYNGHGNPQVLSGERIVTEDDYNSWNNTNMLPIMITATCDFGQFDQPSFVSSAEKILLRSGGGAIALLTTTQAVYAFYNVEIHDQYIESQLAGALGSMRSTIGSAYKAGKNITYAVSHDGGEIANFRKFSLLGDPALTPDFPQNSVVIDSLIDGYTQLRTDTVKALGSYEVSGHVADTTGNLLSTFNGLSYVTLYDKPRTITTISGCNEQFKVQDNIVYKGRVTVTNGKFSFSFIAPKDINYAFGAGKTSTYADNGVTDAAGGDTSVTVGGYSDHPIVSSDTPIVKPYINDSLFLNGGITGSNTSLYATFYDKTGINVSGNEVGHDLTGVLDGNVESPYILNGYYETAPNTYQYGYLTFPISGLADGPHSLTVKAWDVNNNVGTGTVNFIVVDGNVVDIQQLGNYPNPFSNTTHFVFEHNHPDESLNVQIMIYNVSGAFVKEINQQFIPTGSRTADITWDGTDNNGGRLPSGVYVYRLNISTESGFKSSAYQKLVIVR